MYYMQWPFNVLQGDRSTGNYYIQMNTNSFTTSPTDRLMLGERLTQVTADTGSTVLNKPSAVPLNYMASKKQRLLYITSDKKFSAKISHVGKDL